MLFRLKQVKQFYKKNFRTMPTLIKVFLLMILLLSVFFRFPVTVTTNLKFDFTIFFYIKEITLCQHNY